MGDNFKEAFDYWKYLWIRYRRMPIENLTPDQHNLYTVDNVYTVPYFDDIGSQRVFSNIFSDDKSCFTLVCGEYGKTSLIHAIISIISMNSSYANYRGGKQKGVSNYYKVKYESLKRKLFGDNDKRDILPLIINGENFNKYLKNNNKISLIDYAYYIINEYDYHLNLTGEKNVSWFSNWKETFNVEKFSSLIKGAIEEKKLLLLIDGYDQMTPKHQILFNRMVLDFVNFYNNSFKIIATCYKKENIPNNLKINYKEYFIHNFDEKQYEEFMENFIFYVQQIEDSFKLKEKLIEAYNCCEKKEICEIEAKINKIIKGIKIPTYQDNTKSLVLNPGYLTDILIYRMNNNISFDIPLSINELKDVTYFKLFINNFLSNTINNDYINMFKIRMFDVLEKLVSKNEIDTKILSLFEYKENDIKKNNLLYNSSKLIYKFNYDNNTAAQIKEYIQFISKNIG